MRALTYRPQPVALRCAKVNVALLTGLCCVPPRKLPTQAFLGVCAGVAWGVPGRGAGRPCTEAAISLSEEERHQLPVSVTVTTCQPHLSQCLPGVVRIQGVRRRCMPADAVCMQHTKCVYGT